MADNNTQESLLARSLLLPQANVQVPNTVSPATAYFNGRLNGTAGLVGSTTVDPNMVNIGGTQLDATSLAGGVGGDSAGWLQQLGDYTTKNATGLTALTGLGNLGLSLANYPMQQKLYGKQMGLLDQQIASNAENMQRKKNIESSFQAI